MSQYDHSTQDGRSCYEYNSIEYDNSKLISTFSDVELMSFMTSYSAIRSFHLVDDRRKPAVAAQEVLIGVQSTSVGITFVITVGHEAHRGDMRIEYNILDR
jgi:hypothetical protein